MPVHVSDLNINYTYRGANDLITIGAGINTNTVSGVYVNGSLVYPSTYIGHYSGSGTGSVSGSYHSSPVINYRYSIESTIKTKNALARVRRFEPPSFTDPFSIVTGGGSAYGSVAGYTLNNGSHTNSQCKYVNHDSVEYEVEITSVDGGTSSSEDKAVRNLSGVIMKGKFGYHDGYDLAGKHLELSKYWTGTISDDYKTMTLSDGTVIDLPSGSQRYSFPRYEQYIDDFVKLRNYVGSDSSVWHRPYYSALFDFLTNLPRTFHYYALDIAVPYIYQGETMYVHRSLPMKFTEEIYVNFDTNGDIVS